MDELLVYIIEFIHLSYIFLPILFILIPIKYLKKYFKYIFLIAILTPISWNLNNNKCFLSDIVISIDDNTTENISRKRLKWLYNPILNLLGLDWNKDEDLDYVIYLHWTLNYIILWVYLFYIAKCKVV
mgnify:CR=1 FL=1